MKKTIAITGASGQIGYALTFQLMHVLKEDTIRLHLIDLPNCQNALEALKIAASASLVGSRTHDHRPSSVGHHASNVDIHSQV